MHVEKWSEIKDGPFSLSAMQRKLEQRGYTVSQYTYPPGTYFPDHSHAIDKIDAVISGRFEMGTKEGKVILEAGDCLVVPKGTLHNAKVIGNNSVISLDATKD